MWSKTFVAFLLIGVATVLQADQRTEEYFRTVLKLYQAFIYGNDLDTVKVDPLNIQTVAKSRNYFVGRSINVTGTVTGLADVSIGPGGCHEPVRHMDNDILIVCSLIFNNLRIEYNIVHGYSQFQEKFKVSFTSNDVVRELAIDSPGDGTYTYTTLYSNDPVSTGNWTTNDVIDSYYGFPNEVIENIQQSKVRYDVINGDFFETFSSAFYFAIRQREVPEP